MGDPVAAGMLRRIRQQADLSQRELADACGISQSTVARVEAGRRDVTVGLLAEAAALAGLRLALLDARGDEVAPMDGDAVRDEGGRHFPAHLDTRHGDDGWWHGPHRFDRRPVTYTSTRDRTWRDRLRQARGGVPDDHQLPRPGDSLAERAAARRAATRRARADEQARRLEEERGQPSVGGFRCECPPACDDLLLDERPPTPGRPGPHAPDCVCGCDLS
ncbi:helix-turn-helix domain-containing protein [Geodermatophilus normandii]|uniref:Helix-turn-helix transcriptional regulator n=1 Tax=Geodermatophilus normandii TaxID=1137989 RepID=A0A6P0GFP3_9ACTN|nr:helix-turn-helix transcriptional regulator [Geodermatophilus normandii]NEM06041.1 helix-turn-helix transcriptional regulator [Geodermatophilus normandii]